MPAAVNVPLEWLDTCLVCLFIHAPFPTFTLRKQTSKTIKMNSSALCMTLTQYTFYPDHVV